MQLFGRGGGATPPPPASPVSPGGVALAAAPTPRSGAVLLGASSSPTVAEAPECRICLEAEGGSGPLIRTACACAGTLSYAHLACL